MISQRSVGKSRQRRFQQLDVTGTITGGAQHQRCLTGCRFKGAMHPQLAAAPVIRFKGGSAGADLPRLAGIGLHRQWPQFIDTDHPGLPGGGFR